MSADAHTTQRATPTKCASCNRPMNTPVVCDSCRQLHPATGLDHFTLFGLLPTFDVDPAALRQKYLRISRDVHPDHHADGGAALSMHVSAQLNEAYRVLLDPLLRAEYLLELAGGKSAAEDKSVPPDVLATTLELRELIADARATDDQPALERCRTRIGELHERTLGVMSRLAGNLPGDQNLRNELRSTLNALKYYARLLTEAAG